MSGNAWTGQDAGDLGLKAKAHLIRDRSPKSQMDRLVRITQRIKKWSSAPDLRIQETGRQDAMGPVENRYPENLVNSEGYHISYENVREENWIVIAKRVIVRQMYVRKVQKVT